MAGFVRKLAQAGIVTLRSLADNGCTNHLTETPPCRNLP